MASGVAAKIPGTIVSDAVTSESMERSEANIGHPAGIVNIKADVRKKGSQFLIK